MALILFPSRMYLVKNQEQNYPEKVDIYLCLGGLTLLARDLNDGRDGSNTRAMCTRLSSLREVRRDKRNFMWLRMVSGCKIKQWWNVTSWPSHSLEKNLNSNLLQSSSQIFLPSGKSLKTIKLANNLMCPCSSENEMSLARQEILLGWLDSTFFQLCSNRQFSSIYRNNKTKNQ